MESEHITLGICQKNSRLKCLEKSKIEFNELQPVFFQVFDVFNDVMHGIWNNYELTVSKDEVGIHRILAASKESKIQNRIIFESILSVFSLSLIPIKNLIFEGSYISACTLLRSNIEAMVQLRKILEGRHKDGQIPRISEENEPLRRIYSKITGLAHLSDSPFLSNVTKGHSAIDSDELLTPLLRVLTPQFNSNLGEEIFALHITCSIEIILRINTYLETHIPSKRISEENLALLAEHNKTAWAKLSL